MKRTAMAVLILCMTAAILRSQAPGPGSSRAAGVSKDEQLAIYRNLGKAFYENPTTQQQAVEQFQKALELAPDSTRERVNYGLALLRAGKTEEGIAELQKVQEQDPKLPYTWFNLGIAYKKAGDYDKATAQFEGMIRIAPDEPVSHYNLGYLYRLADKTDQAVKEFETAEKLNPSLAGPHFQLYNAYRATNRAADADRELKTFQQIRAQQAGAATPEDLDWSQYAEIYDIVPPAEVPPPAAELKFDDRVIATGFDPSTAGLALLDYDADGRPDLIAWSANGVKLFRNGADPVNDSALATLKNVRNIAPGDFNNDGYPDLAVITDTGASLYVNQGGKGFQKAPITLPPGQFSNAIWLDYDHDYDLDLILLGDDSKLARNNGAAGFSDMTKDFPFLADKTRVGGVVIDLDAYANAFDLLVAYPLKFTIMAYRDRLGGKYVAEPLVNAPLLGKPIMARDIDNDGWTDVLLEGANGFYGLLMNHSGKLQAVWEGWYGHGSPIFADLENRGRADIVDGFGTGKPKGDGWMVSRNEGGGKFSRGPFFDSSTIMRVLAAADFDGDGETDLAAIGADGILHFLKNQTETKNSWIEVSLTGIKNLKLAPEARVEVKAGSLYLKQTYKGVPLTFGIGQHTQIDTIRITWPNGLIQNEVNPPINQHLSINEAQRLSGSCPMIFTWNGQYFQFITDVLGVAPLGASLGDGVYFPVDHIEYIQVPGSALKEVNGKYEIRITEELREVSYMDEVQLIAVDHPAREEIFTNERFKSPPFPTFQLYGASKRVYPKAARDQDGNDVLARLFKKDATYPDTFKRDYSGVAELHNLDLDFGDAAPNNRAVLILSGWLDWADGSTYRAVSQETKDGLVMPYLQVKDAAGKWQTVIEDMGIPAGKPKTVAIDLTGKFLSKSREVRIVTSLSLYWDEAFLSEDSSAPKVKLTPIDAESVQLSFRGFSRPVIHPERKQPEQFNYDQWMPVSMWNPTPGLYTRYGDVLPLVLKTDDKLVLMGSGDEMRLLYPADKLPPLPSGWTRDFLLLVDGWAKDQDANTAYGTSVEPLPFHGMSQYPYPANEHFPDDAEHRAWRAEYNTRPALKLVRPLLETARHIPKQALQPLPQQNPHQPPAAGQGGTQ